MSKHLYRHTFLARIEFEREYDPAKPETFTELLGEIDSTRKGLTELGAEITRDTGRPVTVRE